MDLLFATLEVVAVILAVMVARMAAEDGESNWLEGAMLLMVYAILGFASSTSRQGRATTGPRRAAEAGRGRMRAGLIEIEGSEPAPVGRGRGGVAAPLGRGLARSGGRPDDLVDHPLGPWLRSGRGADPRSWWRSRSPRDIGDADEAEDGLEIRLVRS